jgi:Fe-S-cluster containining protein
LSLPFRDAPEADFRIILGEKEPSSWRYHRLQLRREPTPSESHAQRCLFLQGEPGAIRCGIYPFRPRACIAFPYQEQGEAVRRSRLARVWCPPGAWVKDEVDVPAHRLLRREQASDRAHYDAVIDRWNDAAKTHRTAAHYRALLAAPGRSLPTHSFLTQAAELHRDLGAPSLTPQ